METAQSKVLTLIFQLIKVVSFNAFKNNIF